MTSDARKALCNKARTIGLDQDDVLSLVDELETWVDMALRLERHLHDSIKQLEKICPKQ